MAILNKGFFIGIGVGAALTLLILEVWGGRYQRQVYMVSLPQVVRPLVGETGMGSRGAPEKLPRAWVPQTSGAAHDNWQLEGLDGKKVNFSQLTGRVVFLNFWSTG